MANTPDFNALDDALRASAQQLGAFTGSNTNETRATGILTAANRESAKQIREEQATRERVSKEFGASLSDMAGQVKQLGLGLARGNSSLTSLEGVMTSSISVIGKFSSGILSMLPIFGSFLSSMANAATDAAKAAAKVALQQFQQGWDAYRELADTGVVKSFTDLKEVSTATGVTYANLVGVMGKYSNTLATFNSSANAGQNGFKELSTASADVRAKMYALGIGAQEFTEFQLKYLSEEIRMGTLRSKDAPALATSTMRYIEELDEQAKLYGMSRREAQSARDVLLSNDRLRAALNIMRDQADSPEEFAKIKASINSFNTGLQKSGPKVAAGMADLIAGNGQAGTSELARELEIVTGGEAGRIAAKLRSGQIKEFQAREQLNAAMAAYNKQIAAGTQYSNKGIGQANFAEREAVIAEGHRTKEDIDAVKKNVAANDQLTSSVSRSIQQLDAASQTLQDLATDSKIMETSIKFLTDAIGEATNYIKNYAPKPAYVPETQPVTNTANNAAIVYPTAGLRPNAGSTKPAIIPPAPAKPAAAPVNPTPANQNTTPAKPAAAPVNPTPANQNTTPAKPAAATPTAPPARTGGIFKGPSTGYLVEMSGDNAVIPANDGVSKQALSTASTDNDNDLSIVDDLYSMMNDKFSRIVELMNSSDGNQRKLLRTFS